MRTKAPSIVAVVKGPDRYKNIREALALLGDQAILGKKHVIKPNFVSTEVRLAATHREAARAVVDFLREETGDSMIIAEGAAASDTFKGYDRLGFNGLATIHGDVECRDLNRDAYEIVTLLDEELRPQSFRIAKTIWDSDHRISLAIPKTHDAAMVTLSLKNMVVGSLIRDMGCNLMNLVGGFADHIIQIVPSPLKSLLTFQGLSRLGVTKISGSDKVKLHQGYLNLHLFLYQLVRIIPPHLCILDGYVGMEGNGPVAGTKVDWHIAIAGSDGVAVDTVAAHLMGFDPKSIGYLHFCSEDRLGEGDINKIEIKGLPLEEGMCAFRPHQSYEAQLGWKKKGEAVFKELRASLDHEKRPYTGE